MLFVVVGLGTACVRVVWRIDDPRLVRGSSTELKQTDDAADLRTQLDARRERARADLQQRIGEPFPNLTLIKGDIRDTPKLAEALKGVDTVIHLACISNDASFELDKKLSTSINLDAFEPMVIAARKAGVKRFVYASSSSVYGVSDAPDVTENHPLVPLTHEVVVESGAMVAAGALVGPGKRVGAGELWGGVPARRLRSVRQDEYAVWEEQVQHYVDLAALYRAGAKS